jgi:uncharacterized Tic20 family protein
MAAMDEKDARTWAMLCHLGALVLYVIWLFPIGHIIAPLIIWLIKKDESPFVDDQGKESLNFQISMAIYFIIGAILIPVFIGIPILIALGLFHIIIVVVAAVKSNSGEKYRYPLCIRFIK